MTQARYVRLEAGDTLVDSLEFKIIMDKLFSMPRKGHKKGHRCDLNEISHYIAANYGYMSLFWNAYAVNVHDLKAFPDIVMQRFHNNIRHGLQFYR